MKSYIFNIIIFALLLTGCGNSSPEIPIENYVMPFYTQAKDSILFPGAIFPLGGIQIQPNTSSTTKDGIAGYVFSDDTITSFSHTHIAIPDGNNLQDILVMPTTNVPQIKENPYTFIQNTHSGFSHSNEIASTGYYRIKMDNDIEAEMTVTPHCGIYFFHFPVEKKRALALDLTTGNKQDVNIEASIRKVDSRTIQGYRKSSNKGVVRQVYYIMEFSQDIEIMAGNQSFNYLKIGEKFTDSACYGWIDFGSKTNQILAKVSLSSVNCEGAAANMAKELSHWSFDKVKRDARQEWRRELSDIRITSDNEEAKNFFYTYLYNIYGRIIAYSDVNGNYKAADGEIHSIDKRSIQYSGLVFKNIYRATFPLLTITQRYLIDDFITSISRTYDEMDNFYEWESFGNVGKQNSVYATSIISEALLKNFNAQDKDKLYNIIRRQALKDSLLIQYNSLGYTPDNINKTLEYSYLDQCIADISQNYQKDDYYVFSKAAENYRSAFNHEISGFCSKDLNGKWGGKENRILYALHAPCESIDLYGGEKIFTDMLDSIAANNLNTEGIPEAAYLCVLAGYSRNAQRLIDTLRRNISLCNTNEREAWYIFSALGFYPVQPTKGMFIIGTPLFDKVSIKMGPERFFNINVTKEASNAIYVKDITLNGKPLERNYITYSEIVNGGDLDFILTNK